MIVIINKTEYNCSSYERTTKNLKLLDVVIENGITSMEFGNINWDIVELPTVSEPTLEEIETYKRKKFKGQREELLKKLPHDKVICKLDDEDLSCPQCDGPLVPVGQEFIRTEIEYIPAKVRVIDYYRESYECRSCKKQTNLVLKNHQCHIQ